MASPNFDLFERFEIWNSQVHYNSCVGYAKTTRKRCGWELDSTGVTKQLKNMSNKLPHVEPTRAELMKVASEALCHHHKRQASGIATKWKSLIDDLDLEDLCERMRNARMDDQGSGPRSGGNQRAKEETKRKQEEKQEQEQEQERARQKAERERQEEEKKKREAREAEEERRSWRQAWKRYEEAKKKFKEKNVRSSSGIPWPVRSGRPTDVNEQNVKAFYRNALPGATADEFYKAMQQECLIWHPDKAKQFIASLTLTAAELVSMAIIARMVIELHKEYKERRRC